MSTVLRLTFTDGEVREVKQSARLLINIERHFGEKRVPRFEGALYGAWLALAPGVPFEPWVDTIEDFSEETVDPTTAPSSDG